MNPFDVALSLGISVRFLDVKTLEGMFARQPAPHILLPSSQHRPFGRITFSCAHELGHFQLGHATTVDEVGGPVSHTHIEEIAADAFASWLLMPLRWPVLGQLVNSQFGRCEFVAHGHIPTAWSTIPIALESTDPVFDWVVCNSEFEKKFEELFNDWRMDTMFVSSSTEKTLHKSFQRIIGLGPDGSRCRSPLIGEIEDWASSCF